MSSSAIESECLNAILDGNTKGPCNIPKIKFMDVESAVVKFNIEMIIRILQELHSKYQYMEISLLSQKKALVNKLADITDAIEAVLMLKRKREENPDTPLHTRFILSDSVYAKASVKPCDTIFMWLGANVLMESPLDEAETLLTNNKDSADTAIQNLKDSLRFLRCQLTTTEVNVARVHNYGVILRQQNTLAAETSSSS